MKNFFENQGSPATVTVKQDCTVFSIENETGTGTITAYEVFPGVVLAYNDFHMQYYNSSFVPSESMFCVDHCREGRLEYPSASDAFSYVEAGDLKLDNRRSHTGIFEMPLSHYHGAMVSFDMETAEKALARETKDFPVRLSDLQEKFCSDIYPTVIHGAPSIEHIFAELYAVPEKIKLPYFKVKILELLLYLYALELPDKSSEKPYFYKTQVEKVKGICKLITSDLEKNYTQAELSARFDMPLTNMKLCFKSVYGATIGSYLTCCRMNRAAVMLKTNRDMSVTEIAGKVGYDSPSKFAIAFRKEMGMSPTEYRSRNLI